MPIYEYQCKRCGQFEVMQRITEPRLTRCPTCEGKVTKLISHTSFQLKGTGWYVTDYARKGGQGKDAAQETTSESATGSATAEGSSTKSAAAESKSGTAAESKSDTTAAGSSASKPATSAAA